MLDPEEIDNLLRLLKSVDESNINLGLAILKGIKKKDYPEPIKSFLNAPCIAQAFRDYKIRGCDPTEVVRNYNSHIIHLECFFGVMKDLIGKGASLYMRSEYMPDGKTMTFNITNPKIERKCYLKKWKA